MKHYLGLACVLLAWPAQGATGEQQAKPRPVASLLAADSVGFICYDGYDPHKKAYDRTALGRAMRDDLGEFLEYVAFFLTDKITASLQERNPGDMQLVAASWKKLAEYLWGHGFAAGVELSRHPGGANVLPVLDVPARVRLTLVFPEGAAGKNRAVLVPLLNIFGGGHEKQVGGRTVHERTENNYRVAWWQEGRHLILVLGNDDIEGPLAVADGRRPNLQSCPLLRDIAGFKDYETDIRGFLDLRKIVDVLRRPGNSGDTFGMVKDWLTRNLFLHQLGLTSLKSLVFHLGFDRQYQRSTIVVHVAEPQQRAGLARLVFSPVRFDPETLPPLPPDAASVRVSQVDWKALHDYVKPMTWLMGLASALDGQAAPGLVAPDLGVDIPREILAHLDSTLVLYNSFTEGPFFLGQAAAIKVKDEKKLDEGLQKLIQGLGVKIGGGTHKQTYRGVDLSIYAPALPLPVAPTYAIHKGWLVIGVLPQSVKGYILRAEGKHKVWQAPPLVGEALALAKKKAGPNSKLAAVTVTDPRSTTAVALSLLPLLARYAEAAGASFDVAKIPSTQAVTEWQFPGVTLFYDDGAALRWESHSAFEPPGEWIIFALPFFATGL